MRRLTRVAAVVAAGVIALSTGASGGPILAAGPPLRYLASPPGSLDPAFIADAGDVQILLQLYAGLTRLDETGEPYPSLASGWEISDDGLTYRFVIRDDLEFSDGSPLVADDIRRSWLRLLDPAVGATAPDVLSIVAGAARTPGGRHRGGRGRDRGAGRHDARRHPAASGLVLPRHRRHAGDLRGARTTPTPRRRGRPPTRSSGAARTSIDGTDGLDLVLRANARYVAGPPPIDEIRWVANIEANTVEAFADDQIDLAQVAGWDATWIAYDKALGPRLHVAEPLAISYFGFDTTRPPFDDERVRLAFSLALDRERLVPLSEGASAQAAASLVPPAIWPDGFAPEPGIRPRSGAGAARRCRLRRSAPTSARSSSLGNGLFVDPAVAAWREELGVDVSVETMDFGNFLELLDTRPPHLFTVNWIADYTSPNAIYGLLLEPGALSNYGDWRDDDFVALLEAAAAAPVDDVGAAYAAVEERVAEQAPVIPWSYGKTWWLVADGLRGLGNLTIGLIDFGRVSWDG